MEKHTWPLEVSAPRAAAVAALSRSAVSVITSGSLPPSSSSAGMNRRAQASATLRPLPTLPVKEIRSALSTTAWPVSPSPSTISKISASSGTSRTVSIRGLVKRGVTSEGLSSTAQPANSGGITCSMESMVGAFHGLITPTSG